MENIRGCLLDKDGTLINIKDYCFSVVSQVVEDVLRFAVGDVDPWLYERLMDAAGLDRKGNIRSESPIVASTNREIALLWEKELSSGGKRVPEGFVDYALRRFDENCVCGTVIPTTPHLKSVLERLRGQNIRIGVATSDQLESTRYCLEQAGVLQEIDDIFSADRVVHPKPAADTMELACRTWGLTPEQIVMVGDSENDMRFAREAGCWGIYLSDKEDGNLPPGAQIQIRSLEELRDILFTFFLFLDASGK